MHRGVARSRGHRRKTRLVELKKVVSAQWSAGRVDSDGCARFRLRFGLPVVGADLFHRPDRSILQAVMMMSVRIARAKIMLSMHLALTACIIEQILFFIGESRDMGYVC